MIKVVAVPGHGGTGLCLLLHSFRAAAAERALLLTTVAWTWAWEYILFSSDRPVGRYGCCSHHPHVERVADLPRSNAAPCATTRNQEVCEITKEAGEGTTILSYLITAPRVRKARLSRILPLSQIPKSGLVLCWGHVQAHDKPPNGWAPRSPFFRTCFRLEISEPTLFIKSN